MWVEIDIELNCVKKQQLLILQNKFKFQIVEQKKTSKVINFVKNGSDSKKTIKNFIFQKNLSDYLFGLCLSKAKIY